MRASIDQGDLRMFWMEPRQPITLEVLDARRNVVSGVAARLCSLDGEMAEIDLLGDCGPMGLHWGAKVRFWIGSGCSGYEVTGAIVGMKPGSDDCDEPPAGRQSLASVCVRLFECLPRTQQRNVPRRRARIAVRFLALPE